MTTEPKQLNKEKPKEECEGGKCDIGDLIGEKSTEMNENKDPEGTNELKKGDNDREEQERTKIKKKLFIETYGVSKGVISIICEKIGIDRGTFYLWEKNDPEFVKALEKKRETLNAEVEDVLMGLVLIKKHPPSVHYYLDRRHPRYKPKSELGLGGLNDQPLPPIQIEIIEPNNGNNNTQKNKSDNSIPKDMGQQEKDNSE